MRILVVCQYYYPENFQITPICEQLAADGHEVTVLTGLPNYPTGVVPEEYKKGRRDEMLHGVHVLRCHELGRKKGAAHLALNYLSFVLSASRKIREIKGEFDLVFIYQLSPVLMAIPGVKFARTRRLPVLLYCCDLWPESMKMYIRSEKNPLFAAVKRLSTRLYRAADRIALQSGSFRAYFRTVHGIPDEKLSEIPAFADETYLSMDFTPQDETVDFVFLGNLGIAQDLLSVLKAVETIREVPGFRVHFVGDGAVLPEMRAFVSSQGLEDVVVFHGRRPVEEMPAFYKLADACLVSLKADNAIGLTLPAKVQGYMAAGKPIIGMIDGQTSEVVAEAGCGCCVPAGDVAGLAGAMRRFITDREAFAACGENGRDYFRKHYRKAQMLDRLEREMERTVEEHVCL